MAHALSLFLSLSLHSCAILCVNRDRERERDELWQHSLRVAKLTLSAVDFHQPQCFSAPLTLLACSPLSLSPERGMLCNSEVRFSTARLSATPAAASAESAAARRLEKCPLLFSLPSSVVCFAFSFSFCFWV